MTSGFSAFGTKLKRGGTAGTAIAEVTELSGPTLAADTIEMTSHDSTSGYREFIGGLKDPGEVKLSINYLPAGATHKNTAGGLLYDYEAGTATAYALVFPDAATTVWTFNGIVTGFETGAPIDDKLSADVTIKLAGKPTLA